MNILFVAEKPSIATKFKEIISSYPNDFKDNYFFDYVRFVSHFDDDFVRMRKKNNTYYLNAKKVNFKPLTLKSVDIPMDTYLENMDCNFCYSPDIDVSKMDKIICICDCDTQGFLAFAKYMEVKNISNA